MKTASETRRQPAQERFTETSMRRLWRKRRSMQEASSVCFTPDGPRKSVIAPLFEMALNVFGWMLERTPFYEVGYRNAHRVVLREIELTFDDLPEAFDGYRVLHLTDLHIDATPSLAADIESAVSDVHVDVCVMTGDYRLADDGAHHQIIEPLGDVLDAAGPQDGTIAILGNHDDQAMVDTFEQDLGVRMLLNERAYINRDGASITVSGTDDVNRFYSADATATLTQPVDGFGLALVHSPEMADEAASGGHDLYLCGHTHGGQIALPNGKPLITHLNRNRDLASGLWERGGMTGYTSPGAGFSGLPIRFNTKGEVTLFTLRCGAKQSKTTD